MNLIPQKPGWLCLQLSTAEPDPHHTGLDPASTFTHSRGQRRNFHEAGGR